MKEIGKFSTILLFILAFAQNAAREASNNNVVILIVYYVLFAICSFLTFHHLYQISDVLILKIASILLGTVYPLLYSMGFINSLVDFGKNENNLGVLVTLLSLIIFLLFTIGLFRQKELNNRKLTFLKIISIIHTVLFLISPLLTFFSKWFFYGALMSVILYKKKIKLLNGVTVDQYQPLTTRE